MFEDVFEPFDDIVGEDVIPSDEWGEIWDTGQKEDVWRSGAVQDAWTPASPIPGPITVPIPGPITEPASGSRAICDEDENDDGGDCGCEDCGDCQGQGQDQGTGLFDDLFLDIF